jgi:hypothetical protein
VSAAHCFHWVSLSSLSEKKKTMLYEDRCCFCAATRRRTARVVTTAGHGPHCRVTEHEDTDVGDPSVETCTRGAS